MPGSARRALPLCVFLAALSSSAQEARPSVAPPDPVSPAQKKNNEDSPHLTLRGLPKAVLKDQKVLWLRPFRLDREGAAWTLGLLGATAGLVLAVDRPVAQGLAENPAGTGRAFSNQVGQFSGGLASAGVAGAFFLAGQWRNDERARATGLSAFRAMADTFIVVQALKAATQRPRPADGAGFPNHNADGQFFTGGSAFPSGHAAQAWALAAVVAHQYGHRRWVPVAAYGLAGFLAGSRVTSRKHFPSDVLVGAALGYLIGRLVVKDSAERERSWRVLPSPTRGGGAAVGLCWEF